MTGMSAIRRLSPPMWARILAVVVGALIAAQVVTLALTVFFPPAPPSRYSLSDIGAALRGAVTRHDRDRPLTRTMEAAPPSLDSPGWVVSPAATRDLAKLLGAPETDVRLLFYAPPPLVGGPLGPPPPPPRREASRDYVLAGMLPPARGMRSRAPGAVPPGARPPFGRLPPSVSMAGNGAPVAGFSRPMRVPDRALAQAQAIRQRMSAPGGWSGAPRPPLDRAGRPAALVGALPGLADGARPRGPIIRSPLDAAVFGVRFSGRTESPDEPIRPAPAPPSPEPVTLVRAEPPATVPAPVERVAPPVAEPVAVAPRAVAAPKAQSAAPVAAAPRTLAAPAAPFGFAPPSYVEGEFVAALKQADGRWATVRPQAEGFPNTWQRRVMLWFGLSIALIAPIALLVAWRLAAPLKAFAESADRLGREPSADLPPLNGPAEIGMAAEAFNRMQRRIKRYVEDRTGMVRAISHDLRTPLARMRFKLERAPPSLRAAIGRDMDQMEEMIASVLSFMRDEVQAETRQVVDLRSLLEVVVDDAAGPVKLEPGPAVLVEVDVVGVQRVIENLIDNAVKYGGGAMLELTTFDGEACVMVRDEGPGLSPEDLEEIFKPFYRGAQARASGKSGVGLGLSVSRSTIRAHGGELTLRPGAQGLIAEVRLPGARTVDAAA